MKQILEMSRVSLLVGSLAVIGAGLMATASAAKPDSVGIEVGGPAPEFELPGADGKTYALRAVRGKQVLVLVFYRGVW